MNLEVESFQTRPQLTKSVCRVRARVAPLLVLPENHHDALLAEVAHSRLAIRIFTELAQGAFQEHPTRLQKQPTTAPGRLRRSSRCGWLRSSSRRGRLWHTCPSVCISVSRVALAAGRQTTTNLRYRIHRTFRACCRARASLVFPSCTGLARCAVGAGCSSIASTVCQKRCS